MSSSLIITVGIVALALGLIITPLVCLLARRWKFTDQPDSFRKLHLQPVVLGGGISVWVSLWVAIAAVAIGSSSVRNILADKIDAVAGFFIGTLLIVGLGLLDDLVKLRGRHKLLGQIVTAIAMTQFGYVITDFRLFGVPVELGILSFPITVGWLLLAINSLNLIDGVDGLASTVGIILSLTLACLAGLNGHLTESFLLAALAGALFGFLRFNFPPARIYLGDAGSMLIGLSLGALSIQGALKGPAVVGLVAPLAVWTVPFFDTFAAIVRRNLTGRSIYAADRGHLHHCLQQIAGSARRTLYLIVLACGATCMGALASVAFKSDVFAVISAVSVIAVLVATRAFGFGELQLLTAKLRNLIYSLLSFRNVQSDNSQQCAVRFQGSRPWEQLWDSLMAFTDEFHLTKLSLDVNIPSVHEDYHVSWSKPCFDDQRPQWSAEIPLCAGDLPMGRLTIVGRHDGSSARGAMAKLLDVLQTFETRFQSAGNGDEVIDYSVADGRKELHTEELFVEPPVIDQSLPNSVPVAIANGR